MASKPKCKTYIVLQSGRTTHIGCTTLGRYKVGARNEKEAIQFVKETAGKHAKLRVYYEDTNGYVSHGIVVTQSSRKRGFRNG